MSNSRLSSRLPGAVAASAVGVFLLYMVFFRARPAEPAAAEEGGAAPATVVMAASEATPEAAPALHLSAAHGAGPEPKIAPKAEPKPEPKPEPVPTPEPSPTPVPVISSPLRDFQKLYEEGKWREARRALAPIFADTDDRTRVDLAAKAVEINRRLLITHPDERDVLIDEVQHGDSLLVFAKRHKQFHGEYGIVKLVNNIKNDATVRAGAKLRVPRGTWSILVDKSLFTLWLCYEGTPFKGYRVCIGAEDKTPAASWTVGIKNPKPAWYAPPEWLDQEKLRNPIPHGHPKNPLGEYWLALDHTEGVHQGFGIHGTNAPETMGSRASNGCVRMLNDEVVELARVAWKGMEVVTVE